MDQICVFVAVLFCLASCLLVETMPPPAPNAVTTSMAPPSDVKTRKNAQDYLKFYNYMPETGGDEYMFDAIISFQRMANLEQTGELDSATMEMMNMPRCGVRDNMGTTAKERKRSKRYDAVTRWPTDDITWRVNSFSNDLQQGEIRGIMRAALQIWADQANINFREAGPNEPIVDFNIEFAVGDHGDGGAFDGQGRVLAHAFFPNGVTRPTIAGDAHFDDAELFTAETRQGVNLFQVAAHEFGHSLGLDHSDIDAALMAPFYRGYDPDFALHPDDIAGITYLYGARSGNPDVTMEPYKPPGDKCPGVNLDAVVKTYDASKGYRTFALKGSQIWERESTRVAVGYPKQISEVFANLPNEVDAGVFHYLTETTYFFKRSKIYAYRGTSFVGSYEISATIPGLPNDIDSAFIWSGNGRLYFTKDDQYYRYNDYYGDIDSGYPLPLSIWGIRDENGNVLNSVDAAYQSSEKRRTYFFQGDQIWRFNDSSFSSEARFPRNTAFWWFGCGDQSYIQGDKNSAISTVLPCAVVITLSAFISLINLKM